ncbi:zinc finger and SCAN domain-containing protein 5B-like isoform X2 [Maniola hyperantus]|uniref:zinc finger and SCAN domain-containing protein 5B-like isoform X1 n=1 Tax=Aphantopus hyperantus TaxID=2795564 RepID=UPI00374940E0
MEVSPKHAVSGSELKPNQEPQLRDSIYSLYESARYKRRMTHSAALCELCGKKFHAVAQLQVHMHVHTGEKMYKCDICPKRFATKTFRNSHMLNCHGENPLRFSCEVCHKEFKYASNRRRHMLSHQDTRPLYKCDICDKTLTTLASRDQHVSHVHLSVPRPKRNRRDRKPNTRRHSADSSESRDSNTAETSASK